MPINKKKMQSLQDEYGVKRGKEIYYALENKSKKKKKKKATRSK